MSAAGSASRGKASRRAKGKEKKNLPTDVNAALRVVQALNLIIAGATYEDAARLAGYSSRSSCWTAVHRELARRIAPPTDDLLKLELARLDHYLVACEARIAKDGLWAIDRCLKIGERRHKLLGLEYGPRAVPGDAQAQQMIIIGVPQDVLDAV